MTPPAAAASTAPAVHPRRAPLTPPRRPRRVSGPSTRPTRARPSRPAPAARAVRPAPAAAASAARSAARARSLLDSRAIDGLIHGRAWIAIVTFALIGIVTMQLGLLKLNAGIGRALVHEAALQRENSALSVENSEAAAANTIEQQAAQMGMRLVPLGSLRFLSGQRSRADLGRALHALSEPPSTPISGYATLAGPVEAAAPSTSESASVPSEPASASAEVAAGSTAGEAAAATSTESLEGATGAQAGAVGASEATGGATSTGLAGTTGSAAAPEGPQG
jgi:cell division protein FtsL